MNEEKIINILPREVKDAHTFLLNKNASPSQQATALEALTTLLKLEPDTDTLVATLLFQVPDITEKDLKEMKNQFGDDVHYLVKDLLKFSRIPLSIDANEKRKTFIRKAVLVLARDIRALYIKLATRLAKLKLARSDDKLSLEKLSKEAFEIHAPLAEILGLWDIRCELEDLAFRYLQPEEHQKILLYRSHKKSINHEYIKKIEKTINDMATTLQISHTVEVRTKYLYEIYKKQTKKFNSNSLKDILAFQIIVPTVKDCYRMLGLIHSIWKPKHKTLKDYISIPKMNRYQAIHTTVFGPDERVCLFQITTPDMIKQRRPSISKDKLLNKDAYKWLKSTIDNSYESDAQLLVRGQSLEKSIFVFTDKGKIINLPKNSTCIDVAYKISNSTGQHYKEAIVNNSKASPKHTLQTGDTVKIVTSKTDFIPQLDLVEHTHTQESYLGIKRTLEKQNAADQKAAGAEKFDKSLKKFVNQQMKHNHRTIQKRIKEKTHFKNIDEVLSGIGKGEINIKDLFLKLFTTQELIKNSKGIDSKTTRILIRCKNQLGMLSQITDQILNNKVNIVKVSTKMGPNQANAIIDLILELPDFETFYKVTEKLEQIDGITEVYKA